MTYSRTLCFSLVLISLSASSVALAQDERFIEHAQDDAWNRYEAAIDALARGDRKEAMQMLHALLSDHPDHPARQKASALLADFDKEQDLKNQRAGRAELAIGQLLHGAAVGAEICVLADCDNPRVWSGASLAGAGAGLAVSLLATRDGINQATAMSLNLGTMWGAWSSYSLFGAASRIYDDDDDIDNAGDRLTATLLAGQFGGLGLGLLADHLLEPTKGEVAGAFSGGLWAAGISGLLWATKNDLNVRALHGGLFAISQLGLVGGYFLAKSQDMSRSRALLLNTGGFVGGGLGALTAFLAGGDNTDEDAFLAGSAAGAVVGLGLTYFLTRNWDKPDLPVDLSVSPTKGGAMASLKVELP